jgi:hypothetical protein
MSFRRNRFRVSRSVLPSIRTRETTFVRSPCRFDRKTRRSGRGRHRQARSTNRSNDAEKRVLRDSISRRELHIQRRRPTRCITNRHNTNGTFHEKSLRLETDHAALHLVGPSLHERARIFILHVARLGQPKHPMSAPRDVLIRIPAAATIRHDTNVPRHRHNIPRRRRAGIGGRDEGESSASAAAKPNHARSTFAMTMRWICAVPS